MADKTMVDYTRKIKPFFEGVAPIEPTTTAASNHANNSIFYLDGTLVKATQAITAGDTIAVGTNVVAADDVETQIGSLNSALANKADAPTILTQTLAANATTVTFTDIPITGNTIISFYIDGGANYTAINTATAGEVTLTYDAESSARTVYCEIEEVS